MDARGRDMFHDLRAFSQIDHRRAQSEHDNAPNACDATDAITPAAQIIVSASIQSLEMMRARPSACRRRPAGETDDPWAAAGSAFATQYGSCLLAFAVGNLRADKNECRQQVASAQLPGIERPSASVRPRMGIPPSSERHHEESSASDAQILVISTLIALAIVADESPPRNDCAALVNCHNPGR
jgi:hypothetical protein